MYTLEEVLSSIQNKKGRFPQKVWEELFNTKSKLEAGEITQQQADNIAFSKADYYDCIKPAERWWSTDWNYKIDMWNRKEYGVKVNTARGK